MQKKTQESKEKQFEELVIDVKSVVKVNKGGRQRRYSATVVIGDRKGKVGLGIGKANEVPDAIKKAIQDANKNIITIPLIDGRTVAHEAIGFAGAARDPSTPKHTDTLETTIIMASTKLSTFFPTFIKFSSLNERIIYYK